MNDCIPFVISGAPRSGTSLLYNLFDGHSQVAWLVDEGFLFEYLHDLGTEGASILIDAMPDDADRLVVGLRDRQVIPPLHQPYKQSQARGSMSAIEIPATWDERKFRETLVNLPAYDPATLWAKLAHACLSGMGEAPKRYACLKSPDYGKSARAATDLVPNARAVVIVRDPLYAIDSLKRSRELRGEKLLSWPQLALNIRYFQEMLDRIDGAPSERTMCIRYETLTAEPEVTMRELADWLGIPYEDCLLRPTMRGQHWPGISSFESTDGIETSPVKRAVQALTDDEQELIRKHLGRFRKRYGYDA